MRWKLGVLGLSAVLGSSTVALAASPLRVDVVDKAPLLDGVPGEWQRELGKLGRVKGAPSAADLSAKGAVSYDGKNLYVAVDVTDDALKGGGSGDKVELVLIVGNQTTSVSIFPGDPGKSAGKAMVGGASVQGAKVVEAPRKGGWTLEASVPWSAINGASTTRVGMRGGLFVHDADGGDVDAIVGTAPSTDPSTLPPLLTTPEQALADGLIKDKHLGAPSFQGTANVVGDGQKERVLVFDHYVVVLGPTYRGGKQYYFADMAVAGESLSVQGLELRDMDGDGREDLVFRKRFTKSGQRTSRDSLQVLSFGAGDTPDAIFQHEIAIKTPKGSVTNEVSLTNEAGRVTIAIRPGSAKGLEEATYDEATETSFDPLLLPWGTIQSQTYKLQKGRSYTRTGEERRARPTAPPQETSQKPVADKAPAAPPPPDVTKVVAQFKKDRGIQANARFDQTGDVAADGKAERVLLFDRDLVVVGPSFKGGTGYAFTTLSFAATTDITSVTLKDVTGDGKADVLVRGVLHSKGPGNEDVDRDVELVFRVTDAGVKRVFGAEIGRAIGQKRVSATITFDGAKGAAAVVLAPGRATGFTKENYPFAQDTSPVGGLEPLLLPWAGASSARYVWNGSGFAKR